MTLTDVFPDLESVLSIEPEELAGVILEMIPAVAQGGGFLIENLVDPSFQKLNPKAFAEGGYGHVLNAVAEAVSWLGTQGLVIRDPKQAASWYRLTRRATKLKTRHDVEAFRRGRMLPVQLLQPHLAEKVQHLFLRGDHATAVFQAFKEVEVAVRKFARARKADYPDNMVGVALMQEAFHVERGLLTNTALVPAERLAEMYLFAGAIGHAKNPASHRDVKIGPEEAVRLIIFASHLLQLIDDRDF